jgi:hypothetical protein
VIVRLRDWVEQWVLRDVEEGEGVGFEVDEGDGFLAGAVEGAGVDQAGFVGKPLVVARVRVASDYVVVWRRDCRKGLMAVEEGESFAGKR